MADSSVTSVLSFRNYKIDIFEFKMAPKIAMLLEPADLVDSKDVMYNYSLRQPTYLKKTNAYISGFNFELRFFSKDMTREERVQKPEDCLIELKTGIVGFFDIGGETRLGQDVELRLVQVNGSAILFPYLRAAVSLHLASAGFPAFLFPILNINSLAKNAGQEVSFHEIDI
ncbi:hypothetical protein CH354_05830 [Leptospira levettii]|uniref:protein-export chaperone SecB n=1 Tax=Leptospira levettii TaxID=2023178 RepID=UPI000C296092|nr:protein-export chaperone SecB [Leptospira levettii]PJZ38710.1 hypothetical protein CH354_05830 [Leptospira levettii]